MVTNAQWRAGQQAAVQAILREQDRRPNLWRIHCAKCTVAHPCDQCQDQINAEHAHIQRVARSDWSEEQYA